MARMDQGLGFLLQYENVAWYDGEVVKILDRRVYPRETRYVPCQDYRQVAQAITDMVTQSLGPWIASLQALVLTAYQAQELSSKQAKALMKDAFEALIHARPTTSQGMANHLRVVVELADRTLDEGGKLGPAVEAEVLDRVENIYRRHRKVAEYAAALLPRNPTIITQCYAETLIGFLLLVCKEGGQAVTLICPETRPYLQGARLTASVALDMGVPVTVITDNMPGYLISQGIPDVFVCAADVITLDGHVVNKIGTYQIALAAHRAGIPFYVLRDPSPGNPTIDTVTIEERDPQEVLQVLGTRTAREGVKGYYPAFDITPPELVSAVVTSKGVFSPYDLREHFGQA
jgi:methylthioribose-1-phosphate isomerase